MKPEQLEIARLRREVTTLKAERDILKKPRPTSRRNRREVRFHCEVPGDLAGGLVVQGGSVSRAVVLAWLTQPRSQRSRSDEELGANPRQLPCQRPDLRCQAGVERHAGGRVVVRSASD